LDQFEGERSDRDADGFVESVHSPANVTDYDHPTKAFTLSSSVGLVTAYVRGSSDFAGLIAHVKHKAGTSGTAYLAQSIFYDRLEFSLPGTGSPKVTRALPVEQWRYEELTTTQATLGSGPSGARKTALAYTAHSGGSATLRAKQSTATQSAVDTGKNGSGSAVSGKRYLRKQGTPAFVESEDGTFTYLEYDEGLLVKRIDDAQTNLGGTYDVDPNGVFGITETGDGLHKVTTFTYDDLGRRLTVTSNGKTAASYQTRLVDGRVMTISYPKYVDTGSDEFYGPVSFTVTNQAGRVEAQGLIALEDNSGVYTTKAQTAHVDEAASDPLTAIDYHATNRIGTVVRYSVNIYDAPGSQLVESRSYHTIPSSGAGADGTNYDATTFAYDDAGRRIRTKDPTGTIRRTVYDTRGRVSSQWIGTNDYGLPGGEGSGPSTMVKVSESEYDGGASKANSLLTKVTSFIDDTTTDRRETHFTHDYQGRVIIQMHKDDSAVVAGPITLNKYDNMGRVVATGVYDAGATLAITDDPTSEDTDRLALTETFYDELGRVWKTTRHEVDPSDGSLGSSLESLTWYDAEGRVIKVDGEQLTKTKYDRLGRATHQFILASTNDSAYADADDVSGDIVLEEHQTTFDATTGEVIMTAVIERFHTDYGGGETTGVLDTNADNDALLFTAANLEGRIQISASWFDALGRVVDTVAFGTSGGSNFDRDGLSVPSRSATELRTTYTYSADGTLLEVADPRNKKTRYVYDDLGRQLAVIANYVDGTPSGPTGDDDVFTRFVYADGLRTQLWVDLDGDNAVDSGDQVTTYTYGTVKGASAGDSRIATGHLLQKVVYPEQSGGQGEAARRMQYAYNAQSQMIWQKDQEANIIEFSYDDLGRQTHQRVTTIDGAFDNSVLRISTTYDELGRRELVTQYSHATPGSGSVVDEVKFSYDGWGNLIAFDQDHDTTIATATDYIYSVGYEYELAGSGAENGRNTLRRTMMTLPDGRDVAYLYTSGHGHHADWASRVSGVQVDSVSVASYLYNGPGSVVSTTYPEPAVMSNAFASGSPNDYGNLDRFNRVITSAWTADRSTDHDFYHVDVFYDEASNITWTDDTVLTGWDYKYSIDGLNRLTQAERDTISSYSSGVPTALAALKFDQQWTLDQVGNWDLVKLDRNGDTDFVGAGDYNDDRTHNDVNELKARDTDDNGSDNFTFVYWKTGAMRNDGQHYKYVWDAFGRLRKVLNRSNDALVAEYRYNGLGFRISETFDTDTDGDVDGNDATYHFAFDERWRIVSTYVNDDDATDPKEVFVHHAAGAGGYGSSSYIDAVILRDADLNTDWEDPSDGVLEARHYYCQNWRADVSVIIDDSAVIVERVMYSPYGVPFGIPAGDLVTSSSFAQPADGIVDGADSAVMIGAYSGSWNYADLDNDGDVDASDLAILNANWANNLGWGLMSNHHNRLGYAGYVFDEALAGTKWHVRHRVLESVLGRWISRDPMGYVDVSLYAYVDNRSLAYIDPYGLAAVDINWELPTGFSISIGGSIDITENCIEAELQGQLTWSPPGLYFISKIASWFNVHIQVGAYGEASFALSYCHEGCSGCTNAEFCIGAGVFATIEYRQKGTKEWGRQKRFTRSRFGAGASGGFEACYNLCSGDVTIEGSVSVWAYANFGWSWLNRDYSWDRTWGFSRCKLLNIGAMLPEEWCCPSPPVPNCF